VRSPRRAIVAALAVCLAATAVTAFATPAQATTTPLWALTAEQTPTYLPPAGEGKIVLSATDIGTAGVNATHSPVVLTDTLPPGLEATGVEWNVGFGSPTSDSQWPTAFVPCTITGQTVTCTLQPFEPFLPVAVLETNQRIEVEIAVRVGGAAGAPGETNRVSVSGGESLACQPVGSEAGGFVDAACHGLFPYRSEAFPSTVVGRDFEQVATGAPVAAASVERPLVVSDDPVPFGVDQYRFSPEAEGGAVEQRAGSHPFQLTTSFVLNQRLERRRGPEEGPENADALPALPKDARFDLPPGLIGNPTAIPRCSAAAFNSKASGLTNACPADTAVGVAMVTFDEPANRKLETLTVPVFNLEPAVGEPARFGFFAAGVLPVVLDASLRTGGDYGVTITSHRIPEVSALLATRVTFWGVPGDSRHDAQRGWSCVAGGFYRFTSDVEHPLPSCAESQGSSGEAAPFLRLPTSCAGPLRAPMLLRSWLPGASYLPPVESEQQFGMEGCNQLPFDPRIQLDPDVHTASSPSGLTVNLSVPQEASEAAGGLAEADLKDAVVTLPAGVAVNPSSANGLAACAPRQVELNGPEPARCPDAAKIGTVEIDTPLLDHPLAGGVYVAKPHDNPFDSLLAIYIAVDDPQSGVVVKLAGKVTADAQTGQLTTSFSQNPQLPFEDFKLHFFNGPRAALVTPDICGVYQTTSDLAPWSQNGDAHPTDSFQIGSGPGGSPCANSAAEEPNVPTFSAGTLSPLAGVHSPFVLRLSRGDGSQRFAAVDTVLPPGLLGKLAGIRYCPEAALAAAGGKAGAQELASPSCPAASQIGTVTVGAGAGSEPYYVTGKAYLAGPYKGAPLSLAIITPAVAGPYDLGTVVVRVAIQVDPETVRITAISDRIPSILDGIPLNVRTIALRMDRPDFTLNPTNCEAMSTTATAFSVLGQAAPLSNRFQVGDCASLGFKPKLDLRLIGKTKRGGHPRLRAVLKARPGDANIGKVSVRLPHSEFLDQGNIRTVCTRVQFAAGACPAGSIYGHARAITPLLDQPLEGPVYLRSSNHTLPDLVADLNGQIHVVLDGHIDSVHGGIRSRFEAVPDAPVSKFVLTMQGGKKGLLVNSTNLCAKTQRATVKFTAHDGAGSTPHPKAKAVCPKTAKRHKRKDHQNGS
jgi:hypothetical protein